MLNVFNKIFAKKVYIKSFGCPRRLLDAQRLKTYFEKNKYLVVSHPAIADYIIVNTCAFLQREETMGVNEILALQKYKRELIVTGCLPDINPQKLKSIHTGLSYSANKLEIINSRFPNFKNKFNKIEDANLLFSNSVLSESLLAYYKYVAYNYGSKMLRSILGIKDEHIEFDDAESVSGCFYIRVGWGCNRHCTYCSIWRAVGQIRSKSPAECISEFKSGLKKGYRTFNILSDNVGSYGLDRNTNLPSLLKQMLQIKGDYKISISELHPEWIVKYEKDFIELVKTNKITSILSAIQSGNNRILASMGRVARIEEVKNAMISVRNVTPLLKLQTQIIVGFPSETEEEFKETVDAVIDIGFTLVQIYGYSARPNTVALQLKPKVSKKVIQRRIRYATEMFRKHDINIIF